jgi:glycosyltransferase involved in cell wall biosynthesis
MARAVAGNAADGCAFVTEGSARADGDCHLYDGQLVGSLLKDLIAVCTTAEEAPIALERLPALQKELKGGEITTVADHLLRFQANRARVRPPIVPPICQALKQHAPNRKILFISCFAPTKWHAGGLRLQDIIRGLGRRGYSIYLYAGGSEDENAGDSFGSHCQDVRIAPHSAFGEADLFKWLRSIVSTIHDFDILHFEWGLFLDRFDQIYSSKVPMYFTHQECVLRRFTMELLAQDAASSVSRPGFLVQFARSAFLESIAYAMIPNHIVVTEEDRGFASRLGSNRFEIIPTGLSDEFLKAPMTKPSPEGIRHICFVGYFDHYANRDAIAWFLEQVWPQIRTEAGVILDIVGKGNTEELRRKFATDRQVRFSGEVASVLPFIAASTLCIAPLISGAGFRGKVNQYAALGKPTVATSIAVSGLPYAHGDSILIADGANAFADAVRALLNRPSYADEIGLRARQIAFQNFGWEPIIDKLDRYYRSSALLSRNGDDGDPGL